MARTYKIENRESLIAGLSLREFFTYTGHSVSLLSGALRILTKYTSDVMTRRKKWCIGGCIRFLSLLRENVAAFVSLGQIRLSLLRLSREVEGMPIIACSIG